MCKDHQIAQEVKMNEGLFGSQIISDEMRKTISRERKYSKSALMSLFVSLWWSTILPKILSYYAITTWTYHLID